MLLGLEGVSCKEKPNRLFYSLEPQKMRSDLKEVYKIMRGIDRVSSQDFFPWVGESKTRRHWFKVIGERFQRDLRGNFLRVACVWNKLPEEEEKVEVGDIISEASDEASSEAPLMMSPSMVTKHLNENK
eukprot:g47822.t1